MLLSLFLGIQVYDGEKRQGLIPLSRLGRARILTALDDNLAASLLAYPRLDRRLWEMTKTLIPYPRAGRLVFDPEDYDIFLNVDYTSPETEDAVADVLRSTQPVIKKRGQVKFIPRIGRKKRSILIDEKENNQHAEDDEKNISLSDNDKSVLDNLDESETDYLFTEEKRGTMSKSAFAPRIGKKRSEFFEDYIDDKRAAAFTPRIGRAAAFTPRIGRAAAFTPRIGRAAAFTPRIGRAAAFTPRIGRAAAFTPRIGRALVPRIGRTDPRFRLRSRSSFIPRIGRRAALIPRIGRSENS